MTIIEAEEKTPEDVEEEEIPVDETSPEGAPEAAPEAPADVEEAPRTSEFYPRASEIVSDDKGESRPSQRTSLRTARKADWSRDRRSSIRKAMRSAKQSSRIELEENIYSLLIVSEYMSWPFFFCLGAYLIKMALIVVLLTDIDLRIIAEDMIPPKETVAKFILIPLTIAMQEDLMQCFYFFANVKYDPAILVYSEAATKKRFYISYTLRTIDGILSLFGNYFIMLVTTGTLNVFLNFSALQFLYAIDDVFYELVTLGFFGDTLEEHSRQVASITLRRRFGSNDTKMLGCMLNSGLDTFLYTVSCIICFVVFAIVTVSEYTNVNLIIGTASPSMSSMPSEAPSFEPSFAPSNFTGNITDDFVAM